MDGLTAVGRPDSAGVVVVSAATADVVDGGDDSHEELDTYDEVSAFVAVVVDDEGARTFDDAFDDDTFDDTFDALGATAAV